MRKLLIASLAALAGCASNGAPYSARWHELSAEHHRQIATSEGAAWERSFLGAHNLFWRDVYNTCAGQARAAGITEFSAVAVVGQDGVIEEFLNMPKSPHLDCFAKQMVGRQYPAPPVAPFYELFNFKISAE